MQLAVTNSKHRGFSLVEVSIVLVLIGLVVGGIIGARALITSSQTTGAISQLREYKAAYDTFVLKYDGLPGDFSNAATFWPSTTSGNGNGRIHWVTSDTVRAWVHLQLAGLIGGNYSGSGANLTAGTNAPTGKLPGSTLGMYFADPTASLGSTSSLNGFVSMNIKAGNFLEIMSNGSNPTAARGTVDSLEALAIDTKLDDGSPNSGDIIGGIGGNCIASASGGSYAYIAASGYADSYTDAQKLCTVSYRLD